jgi:hypothetical protein
MNRILLALLTLSTLIFTTGCSITPKYRVTIDAITAKNIAIAPSTYDIKALDSNKDTQSLVFQQHNEKLTQILQQQGYTQVTQGQVAKQTIYFDYGLEKVNEETETYSEPDISFHMGYGHPFGGYYGGHPFFNNFYGGGFGGGYSTYSETHIYYNRYVTFLAKDEFNKELWRVDVSSVGESKNLRKIIPKLIEAAAPYIGTNTPEPINLVIKDKPKKK